MMGQIVNLEDHLKPVPYVSPYLRMVPRTEAEVIQLRERRQAAKPVQLPADCEGGAA